MDARSRRKTLLSWLETNRVLLAKKLQDLKSCVIYSGYQLPLSPGALLNHISITFLHSSDHSDSSLSLHLLSESITI